MATRISGHLRRLPMKLFAESFLLAYAAARIAETFWIRPKLRGQIICRYSFPILVSAYITFYLTVLTGVFANDGPMSSVALSTGVAVVLTSLVGRNWSIKTLGVFHSIHIEIRHQHLWVEAGPYGFVRNPYYLSNLIEAFGLALISNARRPLAILCLIYLPSLMHRLIVEERAHKANFQGTFEAYCMRVPALIPNCLCDWIVRLQARKVSSRSFSHE